MVKNSKNKNDKKQDWRKRLSVIYHKLIDNKIEVTWLDLIRVNTRQKYINIYYDIIINEIEPKIKRTKKQITKKVRYTYIR